jgi:NADH:ubiquinone oxidoreductase subunit F (NADH-binding)
MDGSMLQGAGIVALAVAMIVTVYDLRMSLSPETCDECPHCRAQADAEAQLQERLAREYAQRHGFDQDDDDRRIG